MKPNAPRRAVHRTSLALLLCVSLLAGSATAALATTPAQETISSGPTQTTGPADAPAAPTDDKFVSPASLLPQVEGNPQLTPASMDRTAAPALSSAMLACGSAPGGYVANSTSTFEEVVRCSLTLSQPGSVYIVGNGSLASWGTTLVGEFGVAIDSDPLFADALRTVAVAGTGLRFKSVTVSVLKPVTAGFHNFSFKARRSSGTGTLELASPTISVIFIPSTTPYQVCGATRDGDWTTTAGTGQYVVRCPSISVSQPGTLFYASSGTIRNTGSSVFDDYEARLWIENDGKYDSPSSRWQNSYASVAGGSADSFSVSGARHVDPGTHDVSLVAQRYAGNGTVTFSDPTLSVFFFPDAGSNISQCKLLDSQWWFTNFKSFYSPKKCTLALPADSLVFMSVDGYWSRYRDGGPLQGPYEAEARLGTGPNFDQQYPVPGTDATTTRRGAVIEDGGDMSDQSLASYVVKPMPAGTHTFFLAVSKPAGTDYNEFAATLSRSGITVLAFPSGPDTRRRTYLPLVLK